MKDSAAEVLAWRTKPVQNGGRLTKRRAAEAMRLFLSFDYCDGALKAIHAL